MANLNVQVSRPESPEHKQVLKIEVTSATGLPLEVFVLQREKSSSGLVDDSFAAVATLTQIADLPKNSPNAGSNFFRAKEVTLIANTATYMEEALTQILNELKNLVSDQEATEALDDASTYQITSTAITAT